MRTWLFVGLIWGSVAPALAEDASGAHDHGMMDHGVHHMDHAEHDTGMAEHIHHQHGVGKWMLEYRYMRMSMDGLLDGTQTVSSDEVTAAGGAYDYIMAPTTMTMDMHMVMGMYGISERWGVMFMLPYLVNEMEMVDRGGTRSTMSSSGFGDVVLGPMYTLSPVWMLNLGIILPTGSITASDDMVMTNMTHPDERLPYPMQLGSGAFGLKPALTYARAVSGWGIGWQASYTWHGQNNEGYSLGDRIDASFWGKRALMAGADLSLRLAYGWWDDVNGKDENITLRMQNANSSPDAFAGNQGGTRVDALVGLSYMSAGGHMLGVEYGVPLQQDLHGPQMQTRALLSVAYQYRF